MTIIKSQGSAKEQPKYKKNWKDKELSSRPRKEIEIVLDLQ